MSKKPVIVYGASGYTGRLVCEYLRELGIPFIAAGRDAKRVQEVMDKVPGIETADYEVAEVEHSVAALTKLFKGAQVVCNMVGPFIKYGPETVEACLAADAVLLGAVGHPKYEARLPSERPEAGLLALRQALGGFANLRPAVCHPALADRTAFRIDRLQGADLLIVR